MLANHHLLPVFAPDADLEVHDLAAVLTPGGSRGHLLVHSKAGITEEAIDVQQRGGGGGYCLAFALKQQLWRPLEHPEDRAGKG